MKDIQFIVRRTLNSFQSSKFEPKLRILCDMGVKLSVNINKIATLRNARGGDTPNVVQAALDAERFGADGITVHPRPDERHITLQDVYDLAPVLKTEFNIEGYPDDRFMQLIEKVRPAQATLVPDNPDVLTSENGWDTIQRMDFLMEIIQSIKQMGIRTSIFIETNPVLIEAAAKIGTDRIEFYTGPYAKDFLKDKSKAVAPYVECAEIATKNGLGINAGHDLNLDNLAYFSQSIPSLLEVSIGHAIVCDSIYYGYENVINMYKSKIQ